ncbi:MAG: DUF1761 domain-containing protein [Bacteroidales bacterium]
MDISALISQINWLAVLVMTILSFIIGFLWHQSFLFGKLWKAENRYDMEKKINAPLIFGGTALMHFTAFAGLSALVSGAGAGEGFRTGLLVSVLWILPAMTGTYLFANRSLKLLAIDAGMYIVLFALAGLLFGIWSIQ